MAQLEVSGVTKRYGRLVALNDVSATFQSGEVHAVLGENGAGKSTLMSVMSGFASPDLGTVSLDGEEIPLGRADKCKQMGIEMIHQHFTLVPEFTVIENLALGRIQKQYGALDTKKSSGPALLAAADLGWNLEPDARTGQLPVGVQQRIEILKAIGGNANVLIFDEPTAVLSRNEVADLFRVLRRLKEAGKTIILIAHKLSEVLEIADRVTVLRRGSVVTTALRSEVNAEKLANWMVGELPTKSIRSRTSQDRPGLQVQKLFVLGDRKETAVNSVSFQIYQGEILGFGGVDGNGQLELAECLAQIRTRKSGELRWAETQFTENAPNIGYVPQDRQSDGLALDMSIQDNLLVSGLKNSSLFRGPFFRMGRVAEWVRGIIDRFSIKVNSPFDEARKLSGGNQQKLVVSRILDGDPDLLVVSNPGRGLDVKATQYVYERILEARDRGAAVALFSSDLDELYALSDRTVFLSRGELNSGESAAAVVGGSN